ncbi:MAG: hypothetical protein AAF378_25270 [Cyanobacteria bacterium P01_A01_bin.84]
MESNSNSFSIHSTYFLPSPICYTSITYFGDRLSAKEERSPNRSKLVNLWKIHRTTLEAESNLH